MDSHQLPIDAVHLLDVPARVVGDSVLIHARPALSGVSLIPNEENLTLRESFVEPALNLCFSDVLCVLWSLLCDVSVDIDGIRPPCSRKELMTPALS